ncbi:MAG: hypothetical protein C0467_29770 [Planctomycetaceae bacterium]|nr:hypothetical protein [Planctomycetaceae bacterium]
MPSIIIHTLLGSQILKRWETTPDGPFPITNPELRRTFLAGCLGPDMGMFPGGESLFSDLAHYVRSGELARAMIRCATSDTSRAFAWGWATHVLADALIHPFINAAAGDVQGREPLTYAEDPGLHLVVEIGADGKYFEPWKQLVPPKLTPIPADVAAHVASAFDAVYGKILTLKQVTNSFKAWSRWHRVAIDVSEAASVKLYGGRGGELGLRDLVRLLLERSTGLCFRRSRLYALTHPLRPSPRAESLIETAITEFSERFRKHECDKLASLPNYNLDTGVVEDVASYPLTVSTLAKLK